MRKFIVHTRPIVGHKASDAPTVVEIEGELVSAMEDPSVAWLPEGEFRFRINHPTFLHEPQEIKQPDGSKKTVMVPSVYHSHAVYWTTDQAHSVAERLVRQAFDFALRKYGTPFTREEVKQKYQEITEMKLYNEEPYYSTMGARLASRSQIRNYLPSHS
jgi:hypothetical protein